MRRANRHQELMEFLCQAPRVPGSEFGRRVMAELSRRYEKLGYRVHLQQVTFEGWQLLSPGVKVRFLHPEARDAVESIPVVWSASTHGEVTGILRLEGTMRTFEWYMWKKYAVVSATGERLAYILTRRDHVWAQPLDNSSFDRDRPYVIVGSDDCESIEQWMEEGKSIEVSVSVASRYVPNQTLTNVIASSDKTSEIMICAHYDSFYNTVGAHDNASGTAALLGLAKTLANKRDNICFVSFDAEEWNKLGAYSYVREVAPCGDLDHVRLVVNLDSVGVGDTIYLLTSPWMRDKVERAKRALESSSMLKEKLPIRLEVIAREQFPQFDSWPFMKAGLDVIQVGTTGDPQFTYWHDADDTLANVNYDLIEHVVQVTKGLLHFYDRSDS